MHRARAILLLAVCGEGGQAPPGAQPPPPGAPAPIAELDTADDEIVSDLSPDELTIVVGTSHFGQGLHLYTATRTSKEAPFGALVPLFPTGAFDDWGATLSADGLTAIVSSDRGGDADLYAATRSTP